MMVIFSTYLKALSQEILFNLTIYGADLSKAALNWLRYEYQVYSAAQAAELT